jgi:AcrR family transcriptional regulator
MSPDASPRSRRERPAKRALSREAIVDAALAIVREEGIDALTMRHLAQALDTGPASLYVYVANRDELWDLVFDAAIGSIETEPTDPARWREQLHALAGRMVSLMVVEYPGMARLAMAHIPVGDNALRVSESILSLLKAGGVGDQAAAYAADLLSMYVTAIAYEQSLYAQLYADPEHEQREVARITQRFAAISPERFPTLAALGDKLTTGDGEERFSLGLDVLVNGLLATPTEGRLTRTAWGEPGS